MLKTTRVKIARLTGCLLAAVLLCSAASAAETGKSATFDPTVGVFKGKGDKCVRPTEFMRRNHMQLILHQRDETMHEGIRTEKYQLTNCIDCHADPKTNSVLGKDGFCESCHEYAAVSIDCFSCHSSSPEKAVQERKAAVSAPARLIDLMQTSTVEGAR
jgi:[DsrC]-trisulfide reductase subunit J